MTRNAPLLSVLAAALAALLVQACADASSSDDSSVGNGGQAGIPLGGVPGSAGTLAQSGAGSSAVAGNSPAAGGNPEVAGASSSGGSSSNHGGGGASAGGAGASGASSSGGKAGSGASAGAAAAGAAGIAGGGGSAGSGKTEVKASLGCTKKPSQALNEWVESMVTTSGAARPYSVRLPTNYDPARAYPVIVLLHGCGSGTNNVPMENVIGTEAILVRGTGSATGTCWDTAANGKDVAFFDSMIADVNTRFCANEQRVFVVGYSSGSWLVNQLTCIRASVLRGGASVTGGESASGGCGGPVARIFVHDSDDTTNVISGSVKARDRQLTQNSCDKAAQAVAVEPSPCKLYQGCTAGYPVEWCQTSGKQHGRQDSFAPALFWNFFKVL